MRKIFWWGAAILVAAAGAFYLMADFTARHPNSLMSRFVTAGVIQEVMSKPSGMMATGSMAACPASKIACRQMSRVPYHPGMGQAALEECPRLAAQVAVDVNEPIHVDVPDRAMAAQDPATGVPCPEGVMPAGFAKAAERGNSEECETNARSTPPCASEEPADTVLMPTCGDEDKVPPMPYVEEDPESKRDLPFPLNLWFYWLKANGASHGDTHEQSEMVPSAHGGDPICPEMAVPMSHAGTSDCQVDPDYPHEYPGCPHMQSCPHAGHCPAPMLPAETPQPKKSKKETRAHPISLPLHLNPGKGAVPLEDECTGKRGVDTMECRPMEYKNAGFDPSEPF
jgi:hypothetical protein